MVTCYVFFLVSMVYCPGSSTELLSALFDFCCRFFRVFKVNDMTMSLCMFCHIGHLAVFHISQMFRISGLQRSACFPDLTLQTVFARKLVNYVCSSIVGLCFKGGNCCCRVVTGLLKTFVSCFCSKPVILKQH